MKSALIILFCALTLASCQTEKPTLLDGKIIDLTHPFDEETIYWPTTGGFVTESLFEGMTDRGYYYSSKKFSAPEHGGTHIDAPIHFFKGKKTIDQIPIEQTIGPGIMIDLSKRALKNRDLQIYVEDLLEWEKRNGQIPKDSIVLLNTGYGKYWPDQEKYMGTDETGEKAVPQLHFPGLHPGAARWLVQDRSIKAFGIDTPSIDYGQSKTFLTHQILFERNIPAFENIANLEKLPKRGFTIIALPMKIKEGTGAPLRIIAIIPKVP